MNFPSERILRIAIAVIAILGVGVATYIFIADSDLGCAGLPGRRRRLRDGGEKLLLAHPGVNVSIFGMVGWFLILGTVSRQRRGPAPWLPVTLGGFGFSIYLTYLEIWNIEAICQWCVSNATLMTICFLLNTTRLLGYVGKPEGGAVFGGGTARPLAEDG